MLASVMARDAPLLARWHDCGPALLDPLERSLEAAGLKVTHRHAATAADLVDLGSSWAKRLGIPERRAAWSLTAMKLQ